MAISAEQLNIILTAKDKAFATAMEKNAKRVQSFESRASKSLKSTTASFDGLALGVKALIPVLTAAFSVQAFKGALQAAVDIENLSNIAGVATDQFQVLALTSQQFGIGQEKLSDILKDVNDKFGDYVQTGAGPLADFFENIAPKVGLTAAAFADLSSDQKLGTYINALEQANVSQADMTFYMEAIASDSTALVQAFANNSKAISEMKTRAAELGLVIDSETIAKAREAKTELDLMAKVMDINVTNALVSIAPLAIQAAGAIAEISAAVAQFLSVSGNGLAVRLDTRQAAEDMKGLEEQTMALSRAQYALDALNKQDEMGKEPTISQLNTAREKVRLAEEALATARKTRDDQKASAASTLALTKTIESETNALKEQAKANAMSAEAAEIYRIETQKKAYETKVFQGILAAGKEIDDETYNQVMDLGDAWEQAAISASKILNPLEKATASAGSTAKSVEKVNEKLTQMSPLLQQLGFDAEKIDAVGSVMESSMENAFMSIVDGTMTAKDAFRSMAADIIKELYRVLVVQRLVGGFASATGAGSGILGAIGGAFGIKTSASGGALQAGQPSVVGEQGREIFVPSTSGRVLSVGQAQSAAGLGGGGNITVVQHNSFGAGVSRAEINSMMPKIVETTKAAVLDAKKRGGSYGSAFA